VRIKCKIIVYCHSCIKLWPDNVENIELNNVHIIIHIHLIEYRLILRLIKLYKIDTLTILSMQSQICTVPLDGSICFYV